jgi:long-chain acyl-CoA synthetase
VRSREDLLDRIEERTRPKHLLLGREQANGLAGNHAPSTLLEELRERLAAGSPMTDAVPLAPQDVAELVFTSGTTGAPKGVILTHGNLTSNVQMAHQTVWPSPRNRVISLLPLSHMFEQTTGLFTPLHGGASITYISTLRPDVIFATMQARRITNMSCVPQVLQLFRDGIEREVRRQGRERQFKRAHALARRLPLAGRRLLFRAVHQRLGGSFEFFVSGGAYLDPELALWWERVGVKVIQGYGMTEAAPVVASHTINSRDAHSVGPPLTGVEVRIEADGEVLVRGDNVSPGYWEDPAATAEAFVDGWYHTGDLGSLDERGRLHLRGRKKSMIVLANGMNVHPEDVEHALLADARVKDAVVLGITRGQEVEVHAVLLTQQPDDALEIVRAANRRLEAHQQIRGHSIWPDETFPLTPTLKVKRGEVAERLESMQERVTIP